MAIIPQKQLFRWQEEEMWNELDKKRRNTIRMAEKKNVKVMELSEQQIGQLYPLYVKNMRQLGSPPLSEAYFRNFWRVLVKRGYGKAYGCFLDEKLICGLMGYCYGDEVSVFLGASDYDYLDYKPNDITYWNFIRWAVEKGFKRKWNAKEHDIYTIYIPQKNRR